LTDFDPVAIIGCMNRRFRHILRTAVAIFMVAAVLLPLGGRMCPHCVAASVGLVSAAEQHGSCPNCQQPKSACETPGATRSCCAQKTQQHRGDGPSLCGCGDTSPADRPAASPQIDLNSAQFAIAAPTFVWPESNRLETAPEVAAFAPDVPHRILHCSWLN
jgi:hypothetical protein